MKNIKGKKILKNGAIAGYVYYEKDKKWKWRIIGRIKKIGGYKSQIKDNLKKLHDMGFRNKFYQGRLNNLERGINKNKIASNLQNRLNRKYSGTLTNKRFRKKELIENTIKLLKEYKKLSNNLFFIIPQPDKNGNILVKLPNENNVKLQILNNQKPDEIMIISTTNKREKYKIKIPQLNNRRIVKIKTPFGENLKLKMPDNKNPDDEFTYFTYKVLIPENLKAGDKFYAIIRDNIPVLLEVKNNKKPGDILEFVDPERNPIIQHRKKKLSSRNIIRRRCTTANWLTFGIDYIEYIIDLKNINKIYAGNSNIDKTEKEVIQEIKKNLDEESINNIKSMYELKKKIDEEINKYKNQNNTEYNILINTFYENLVDMIKENKISICILNTFIVYLINEVISNSKKYGKIKKEMENLINHDKSKLITF